MKMTRVAFIRHVGAIFDHPSIYMGGASGRGLEKGRMIAELLEEEGVVFASELKQTAPRTTAQVAEAAKVAAAKDDGDKD